MAGEKVKTAISIPQLRLNEFNLKIIGDTPLICHAWSEKAKRMMLDKQTKKATAGKEIRRPAIEFANSLYWLTEKPNFDGLTDDEVQKLLAEVIPKSKFGFPTLAFKAAAIDAAFQQGLIEKKTTLRGAIRIIGEFAEIEGIPIIREDIGRIGMGTADLRFRAEFKTWSTNLTIQYNENAVSAEQIINIFNVGGFANGVGDWRQAKDGSFGSFHVEQFLAG